MTPGPLLAQAALLTPLSAPLLSLPPSPLWWGALAFFAASGWVAPYVAARRAAVQPLPYSPDDELLLVESAELSGRIPSAVRALRADQFARADLAARWSVLAADTDGDPDVDPDGDAGDGGDGGGSSGLLTAAAERVGMWAYERRMYRGADDWREGPDGAPFRSVGVPSCRRRVVVMGASLAAGAVAVLSAPHDPAVAWAHVASVLALVWAGALVALVDHDTLLVDMRSALVGLLAAAVPAAWVAVSSGGSDLPLLAVSALLALVVLLKAAERLTLALFALVARMHALRRRWPAFDRYAASREQLVSALGSGDVWLLPAAFGVPALLFGSLPLLGLMLLCACVSAVLAHLAASGGARVRYVAFGPHLLWAWLPAVLLFDRVSPLFL